MPLNFNGIINFLFSFFTEEIASGEYSTAWVVEWTFTFDNLYSPIGDQLMWGTWQSLSFYCFLLDVLYTQFATFSIVLGNYTDKLVTAFSRPNFLLMKKCFILYIFTICFTDFCSPGIRILQPIMVFLQQLSLLFNYFICHKLVRFCF